MKLTDCELETLWDKLADVPFDNDEEDEMITAENFHYFDIGTPKYYIWNWFDENHSKGIAHLMYNRII